MIWPVFIIISFSYAILSGNLETLNSAIFESTSDAISLCISLLGTICLWNGIMQIANKTTLIDKLTDFGILVKDSTYAKIGYRYNKIYNVFVGKN